MKMFQRFAAGAAALACVVLALVPAPAVAAALNVVASFSIIGDFAAQVGGDRIALRTLVGPDSDAHVYEPRPSDAIAMAQADVVLVNGLEFEGFLARLTEASGTSASIVEVTQGIDLIRDPAGGHYHYYGNRAVFHAAPFDPHAWQSIANAKIYVRNISAALCAADSEGCGTYEANAEAYLATLAALEQEVRDAVDAIPPQRRTVVVAHNAFRYFEQAYGITFLSPQGVSTGSEASAAAVGAVIGEIRNRRAAAVFAENITDTRLVTRIAAEAGLALGGVLYSDALSKPEGPAPTYVDLMRHNVNTIRDAVARH